MALKFETDFSWLGKLPGQMEEARGLESRKQLLADLDSNDPRSMEDTARGLFSTGNIQNMELGLRLQQAAKEKRLAEHKISFENAQLGDTSKFLAAMRRMEGLGSPNMPPMITPQGGEAAAPETAPTAQPGMIGGGLRPMPPVQAPTLGGIAPRAEAPTEPSPQTVAEQQQPLIGPQVSMQQQPAAPPPPAFLQGATAPSIDQIQRMMPQAPRAPQAPTAAPPGDRATTTANTFQGILNEMGVLGTKSSAHPAMRAIQAQLQAIFRDQSLPNDVKEYAYEQTQNKMNGLPVIGYGDWGEERKLGPKRYETALTAYSEIRKEGKTARSVLDTLARMDSIIQRPEILTGTGATPWNNLIAVSRTALELANQYGLDTSKLQKMLNDKVVDPTQARDELQALHNQLLIKGLGGTLGNQISNKDTDVMAAAIPGMTQSREGNIALSKHLKFIYSKALAESDDAEKYMNMAKSKASVYGLDQYLREQREKRSILVDNRGELTPEGKAFMEDARKFSKPPAAVPPPSAALPPQVSAPRQSGPMSARNPSPDTPVADALIDLPDTIREAVTRGGSAALQALDQFLKSARGNRGLR